MINLGKVNLLGAMVDATDYESATNRIIEAAHSRRGFSVSALAIHGVMTTVFDREHRARVNELDLVTPDGQGVRWAMNWLHGTGLADRVYGPRLTLEVCQRCRDEGLPIFLYGSVAETLKSMSTELVRRFPGLEIVGIEPSRFSNVTEAEQQAIAEQIKASGARVVLVGLGCPRQEVFVYEMRDQVNMPCLAVGAAFDYHAGNLAEPPMWVQRTGLHGLYRAAQEPRRLWKRFLLLPPLFLTLTGMQLLHLKTIDTATNQKPPALRPG